MPPLALPLTRQLPAHAARQSQVTARAPQVLTTHSRRTGIPACSTQICPGWQGGPVEHRNEPQAALVTCQVPLAQVATTRPEPLQLS